MAAGNQRLQHWRRVAGEEHDATAAGLAAHNTGQRQAGVAGEGDAGEACASADRRHVALRNDPACVQHDDTAGERLDLVEVVAGEQQRAAAIDVVAQAGPGEASCLDIEDAGGLVEDDRGRAPDEGERQRKATLLAPGEAAGLAPGER